MIRAPFFDNSDRLCAIIDDSIWQLNDGEWRKVDERIPKSREDREAATKIELPKGLAIGSSDVAAVRDNLGVYWFTLQGRLYKGISGAYVEVSPKAKPIPLLRPSVSWMSSSIGRVTPF